MKDKLFILIFLLNAFVMQAQQIIATAGSYAKNTSGSLSWTIGEGIIETCKGTNVVLTQGFQQSNLIITAIKDISVTSFQIDAFPNPTNDFVTLKTTSESFKDARYMLYDLNGKLIQEQKLESNVTNITMNNFITGTYLLKIFQGNKEIKILKIVKK